MGLNKTKRILSVLVICLMLSFMLKSVKLEEERIASALYLTAGQGFDDETGRGRYFVEASQAVIVQAEEQKKAEAAAEQKRLFTQVPKLPEKGQALSDFVPERWELKDSVELDFNKDNITDYVGILRVIPREEDYYGYWQYCPYVLFIIAGCKDGSYLLSFHDENLIRNDSQGGNQTTLRADGDGFTVHFWGGTSWWGEEDYTYDYRDGTWYLIKSEDTYGHMGYITSYEANDWERGVGIRKRRGHNLERHNLEREDEYFLTGEEPEFDLTYEVSLDEMPTLYQAGRLSRFAAERGPDREVKKVVFAEDIDDMEAIEKAELSGKIEEFMKKYAYASYNDENCMLDIYFDEDNLKKYLVMYRWEDKTASVLARAEAEAQYDSVLDNATWYQGKIYYTTEIEEEFNYKAVKDGIETIVQEKDSVGFILHRMNEDGSGKENIFEYKALPVSEGALPEELPPSVCVSSYEVSGGEIILDAKLYNRYPYYRWHSYYRMNIDGSNVRLMGEFEGE